MLLVPMPRAHRTTATAFVEDVFSTYLYTGNGSTQTITNGIDLSGKGGLVWSKSISASASHYLFDTTRGRAYSIRSNSTAGQATSLTTNDLTAFNSNGFSLGVGSETNTNVNSETYASWTFREQPNFFDVVTYTGTGSNTTIAHNLGSVPGMIIVKRTDTTADWQCYHRSLANTQYIILNSGLAVVTGATRWNSTTPTSAVFSVGTDASVNASGGTYVAYLFAHDAGGFGLTGTDNVISCGSYTGNGSATGPVVTLGYEPQWVLVKRATDGNEDWEIYDNMRGIVPAGADKLLYPNSASTEQSATRIQISATGFSPDGTASSVNTSGITYIYIAIRRGPMKVPTDATSVYNAIARTGTGAAATITGVGFAPDLVIQNRRTTASYHNLNDRLRGSGKDLQSYQADAETTTTDCLLSYEMDGIKLGVDASGYANTSAITFINWFFKRAPGFFDEVCYTGTGADPQTVAHNLGKAPELMIFKARSVAAGWRVWGGNMAITEYLALSETSAVVTSSTFFGSTLPTSTSFYVGSGLSIAARTHVAYLFATCAGVSKVGSYTGTGTTKQIDCGFTAGARFVLIKRTDSTGDWYVWDTVRGIIAGNDPYLSLNDSAAEVTGTDYIDTYSAGFELSSTAPAALNSSGGTYIFLAIA